jgi:hypothetical protein
MIRTIAALGRVERSETHQIRESKMMGFTRALPILPRCASSHVADDTGHHRRSQALAQSDFAPSAVARFAPFLVIRFMGTRPSQKQCLCAEQRIWMNLPCITPLAEEHKTFHFAA